MSALNASGGEKATWCEKNGEESATVVSSLLAGFAREELVVPPLKLPPKKFRQLCRLKTVKWWQTTRDLKVSTIFEKKNILKPKL